MNKIGITSSIDKETTMPIGYVVLAAGLVMISMAAYLVIVLGAYVLGAVLGFIALYLLLGLRTVQEQERWVIEFFGKYFTTLKPGLNWILPFIMKVRAVVRIWELKIDLFDEPIKIDFKDGSATPRGAEVWVMVLSPDVPYGPGKPAEPTIEKKKAIALYAPKGVKRDLMTGVERAIYEIFNWQVAIKDLLENAIRSYLNGLFIDDAITQARAGFELMNNLPEDEVERLQGALARWGWELTQVTVMDFDLEPELVKARGQVQVREREAQASKFMRQTRAQETIGSLIEMMAIAMNVDFDEARHKISVDSELRTKVMEFAEELITRRMSLDKDALTDIRVKGAGDVGSALTAIIAAIKKA